MARMKRWMACAVGVLMACVSAASAEDTGDFTLLMKELQKPVAERNNDLIDQKIAVIAGNPAKYPAGEYFKAREIQIERAMQRVGRTLTAEEVKKFTDDWRGLIKDIGTKELDPQVKSPVRRCQVYCQQLSLAAKIPDSDVVTDTQDAIVDAAGADIENSCMKNAALSSEKRLEALRAYYLMTCYCGGEPQARITDRILEMMLRVDHPEALRAYVVRADGRAKRGQTESALKDYESAIADPKSPADVKDMARFHRMEFLATLQRWDEAKSDAVLLAGKPLAEVKGDYFTPVTWAEARLGAMRVRTATGDLTRELCLVEGESALVEVMRTSTLGAEQKSDVTTALMTMLSQNATQLGRWGQAVGYARAAYAVAPNARVPETVTLIQQLLANRSRNTTTGARLTLARDPEDVVRAEAFYARQTGVKTLDGREVVLKPDLSNDAEFPRQLAEVVMPFSCETVDALRAMLAGTTDPQTQALVNALLNSPDAALDAMAKAVTSLGLESPRLSEFANFAARFVRAKFESVALANAFLKSQVHGPAGEDGKIGTADDAPNPLTFESSKP